MELARGGSVLSRVQNKKDPVCPITLVFAVFVFHDTSFMWPPTKAQSARKVLTRQRKYSFGNDCSRVRGITQKILTTMQNCCIQFCHNAKHKIARACSTTHLICFDLYKDFLCEKLSEDGRRNAILKPTVLRYYMSLKMRGMNNCHKWYVILPRH